VLGSHCCCRVKPSVLLWPVCLLTLLGLLSKLLSVPYLPLCYNGCHGLGIVDNDELNSYLNCCSHRREYRIWGRGRKRKPSRRQRELYTAYVLGQGVSPVFVAADYLSAFVRLSCKARTFFICLHGGVVSSIDTVCSSWRRYSAKPSQWLLFRLYRQKPERSLLGLSLEAYWLPALLPGQRSHSLLLLRVPEPIR